MVLATPVAMGLLVVTSLWMGSLVRSPVQVAADAAPPPPSIVTATAEERVLVEPVVLRGEVHPGASVKVLPPAAAIGPDSVVTKVNVKVGKTLPDGSVIVDRAGEPIFGLALAFPLYRDLVGGMRGPDVHEVQRALGRLGYRPSSTGEFDRATQRALARLFNAHAYSAPTGLEDAPGKVGQARAAVATAQEAYDEAVAAGQDADEAKQRLRQATAELAALELAAGPALPRRMIVRLDRGGRRITAVHAVVGSALADADKPLLELDGGEPYVLAAVRADQEELLTVGQTATVLDELTRRSAKATVAAVGAPAAEGNTGPQVRLTFVDEPLPPVSDRTVRVDLGATTEAAPTLAVPVVAVYSRPDGSAFVTVVAADGSTRDVTVISGRIAGGWVAITSVERGAVVAGSAVAVGLRGSVGGPS